MRTDWQLAAERTGNAILSVNPDWLITGGILNEDWSSVNQAKQSILQPIFAPLVP